MSGLSDPALAMLAAPFVLAAFWAGRRSAASDPHIRRLEADALERALREVPAVVWQRIDGMVGERRRAAAVRHFREATGLGQRLARRAVAARARALAERGRQPA